MARAAATGDFDYGDDVATLLPLLTLAHLLGIPDSEQGQFAAAAASHVSNRIPARLPPGMTNASWFADQTAYLSSLFSAMAQWRRREPADDLMTRLVQARIGDKLLDDATIFSTAMLLVVAGDETTKQAICLSLLALDRFPDERAWLIGATGDSSATSFDDRFDASFEELIRYTTPVLSFARTATQDLDLGGQAISAGDKVALFYCSGNRDETEFEHPAQLTLRRNASAQVGFGGGGVHFCLGSRIARIQIRAILRETLKRMPDLHIGQPTWGFSDSVHSVDRMPVSMNRSEGCL